MALQNRILLALSGVSVGCILRSADAPWKAPSSHRCIGAAWNAAGLKISPLWLMAVLLWLISLGCRDQRLGDRAPPTPPPSDLSFQEQVAAVRTGRDDRISVARETLRDGDLACLSGLTALRDLLLERSEITDAGLASLAELPRLEHLRLRGACIGDAGVRHLARCQNLRILNLPQARFTDAGLAELSRLPRLELLRFGSPYVTDAGLAHVKDCHALRFLHLIDTPITDAGLQHLAFLTDLESLYLDGTQVTDEGIESLLKVLPQVHLHIDQQHHDRDPRKHPHAPDRGD